MVKLLNPHILKNLDLYFILEVGSLQCTDCHYCLVCSIIHSFNTFHFVFHLLAGISLGFTDSGHLAPRSLEDY